MTICIFVWIDKIYIYFFPLVKSWTVLIQFSLFSFICVAKVNIAFSASCQASQLQVSLEYAESQGSVSHLKEGATHPLLPTWAQD